MTTFVGENPVIMAGTIVAARGEMVVLGDGRGNSLIFAWTDGQATRIHGSPSDVIIDLPLTGAADRIADSVQMHIEGKAVQIRYVIDPINEHSCLLSYTLCEDMREMLLESEAPALAHKDASDGVRIGMGPDGT